MSTVSFRQSRYSRRKLLRMLGVGAVAATLPRLAFADGPTFPKGAVIRTVLKDYAAKDLAGGATLFHEHMSFAPDFVTRVFQLPSEANGETVSAPLAAHMLRPICQSSPIPAFPVNPHWSNAICWKTLERDPNIL